MTTVPNAALIDAILSHPHHAAALVAYARANPGAFAGPPRIAKGFDEGDHPRGSDGHFIGMPAWTNAELLFYRTDRAEWRAVWPLAACLVQQRADYWRGYNWTADTTVEAWAAVARDQLRATPTDAHAGRSIEQWCHDHGPGGHAATAGQAA